MTDIASHALADGFAALALGTVGVDLMHGPATMLDEDTGAPAGSPADCVFINDYPGPAPIPYVNGGLTSVYEYNVQVLVRGADFTTTLLRAHALLHAAQTMDLTAQGFSFCLCNQSAPSPLGRDSAGLFQFSFNVRLSRAEA